MRLLGAHLSPTLDPPDRLGVDWPGQQTQRIMALSPGARLGHYNVTSLLGEGGMGQVWQATDTQLNRQVALKILPDAFATDPDRLARFKREAQILASLNHPNIAAIYGIEEAEGTRALVLELVEGPTLADRIAKGSIPLDEALPIAKQIAEALEAAHEAGVIHRDLKPANIKVRDDGTVKVLDFGLAKALDPNPDADPSQSPTLTAAATQMGVIMGTAAYMAPEQASGKAVDKRADVWAFGVVLYEMLTGTRPFVGDDVSKTLAHVIAIDPDWSALPKNVPPVLGTFLRGCLKKNPKQRVHDVADVRLAMEGAFETTVSALPTEPTAQPSGWRQALPLALGLSAVAAVIVGLAVWSVRPATGPAVVRRFAISLPGSDTLAVSGSGQSVALSPDGDTLVYAARRDGVQQLFRRDLGQLEAVPIRGTEGANFPVFSPGGEWIGFTAGGVLKKMALVGGPPVTVYEDQGGMVVSNASWGPSDTLVFGFNGNGQSLLQVSAAGGVAEPVTALAVDDGETDHRWPELLPGGEALLFTVWTGGTGNTGLDAAQIAVRILTTGERRLLVPGSFPRYVSTGHIVFVRIDGLWAVPFDLERVEVTGPALPVVEGVDVGAAGRGQFAVAGNGVLVYVPGSPGAEGRRTLVWVDRQGREEPVAGVPPGDYRNPAISPDTQYVAFDDGQDVWAFDFTRQTMTRITTDPAVDSHPLWTADGQQIIFSSLRDEGGAGLYARLADGTGDAEQLMLREGTATLRPTGWGPDGVSAVFHAGDSLSNRDIGTLSREGDREPQMLIESAFNEAWSVVSPNGRWIAYSSNPTGALQVYVERFPGLGERRQISTGGGDFPRWSPEGDELLYRSNGTSRQVWAVSVGSGEALDPGIPELLFESTTYLNQPGNRMYDVASGDRFLISALASAVPESRPGSHLVLVQNWFEELSRLLPVD